MGYVCKNCGEDRFFHFEVSVTAKMLFEEWNRNGWARDL